jgi:hypothetical protein
LELPYKSNYFIYSNNVDVQTAKSNVVDFVTEGIWNGSRYS